MQDQTAPAAFARAHQAALRGPLMATVALLALAACNGEPIDADMRGLGNGFSTADAVQNIGNRPTPDARGVISYPTYQVAVAQQGDTVRSLAARIGVNADELARFNGVSADATLRQDELISLPGGTGAPGAAGGITSGPIDVTTLASNAIDRAGPQAGGAAAPAAGGPFAAEPIRHQVGRGETVYTVSRLYNVPVRSIADWNGLGADLEVREGQFLLIPVASSAGAGVAAPIVPGATPPGQGSPTPVPPSAADPLPQSTAAAAPSATPAPPPAPAAPDVGAEAAPAASNAQFVMPAQGSIIRDFAGGRNEGIDIGASAGSDVRAAAAGTVAAVTTNTEGIQIVVIRHPDNLLTVYTHLDNLTVARDASVTQGQTIGKVRAGDPSFLHFEVRRGMDALDPNDYLP